jgi:hypothetical protein
MDNIYENINYASLKVKTLRVKWYFKKLSCLLHLLVAIQLTLLFLQPILKIIEKWR